MGLSLPQGEDLHTIRRKKTRTVRVGEIFIGGLHPVVVQEMTSTRPADLAETCAQISHLARAGCRLVRVAVPDHESALAISAIKKRLHEESLQVLLVGDVHYDYKLAVASIENGVDKLRINPGNIGSAKGVREIVSAAQDRGIPIRIGVNSGSLEKEILRRYGGATAEALAESALKEASALEALGFNDIVISVKSPDVALSVQANKLISSKVDYPLHIGITEAGIGESGAARSAAGLGCLLLNGIGDTVRVSLTSRDRQNNLKLCYRILEQLRIPYI